MHSKLKRSIAFALCLAMMGSVGAMNVYGDDEASADAETSEAEDEEGSSKKEKDDKPPRTEDEAMESMKEVVSKGDLTLYANTKEGLLALEDKRSGEIWWSNPVDAATSDAKPAQKKELQSGLTLTYAEPAKRATTTVNSKTKGKATMKISGKAINIEYKFSEPGITIPVSITLEDGYLKLYCNTSEIVEEHKSPTSGMIITDLSFMTTFGAGRMDENGYFVIPDGSGAIVEFNNGKTNYRTYTGKVYGRDITVIKTTKPTVTQNVSLPMYGIVKTDEKTGRTNGLMVVADKGDTAASINTYVSRQNKTDYNSTYFDFEIRTNDEYLMGGDSNPLKVFEKRGIRVPEIEVRYYPVSGDDGVNYVDIAEAYRNYLIKDKNVVDQDLGNDVPLFMDIYGGTLKKESVCGIPVTVKQPVTKFSQAQKLLTELTSNGVDSMVVTYDKYNGDNLGEKIADSFSPASTLGGKGDFKKLTDFAADNNIRLFPSVENQQFKTGNGYWTMTNTSVRVSNSYSRIIIYDLAHGVENQYYSALSLFSPASFDKAYTKLIKSFNKSGMDNIAFGSLANTIYGDYGKKAYSRETAKFEVEKVYDNAKNNVGHVLSSDANAYVLPYSDYISNVPVESSKFDLFDGDIPFYQIVMHGVTPYSTTAVNGEADIAKTVLKAVAAGSSVSFDFVGTEASDLKDTKLDKYFYGYYKYWTEDAAGFYKFTKDVLSDVADKKIVRYDISDGGNTITTVYEGGVTTEVDLTKKTVKNGAKTFKLSDYVGEEVIGE